MDVEALTKLGERAQRLLLRAEERTDPLRSENTVPFLRQVVSALAALPKGEPRWGDPEHERQRMLDRIAELEAALKGEPMEGELSAGELALIDQAWEHHKAALPVAVVIDDNQPGRTAIIEITAEPPTLVVGTKLYAERKAAALPKGEPTRPTKVEGGYLYRWTDADGERQEYLSPTPLHPRDAEAADTLVGELDPKALEAAYRTYCAEIGLFVTNERWRRGQDAFGKGLRAYLAALPKGEDADFEGYSISEMHEYLTDIARAALEGKDND